MKKLTCYCSLFILLLALVSCGGDNATGPGPGPDPNPDPGPPTETNDYQTLDVTVTLPEGSGVDLSTTTVMSLSVATAVDASGHTQMAYNKGTTQLAYLFDGDNNLLMAGFVNEDQPEISIKSTTEVLFYIGLGTIFQPQEIKEKFIAEATTIEGFDEFAQQMAQLFVSNKLMLQDGDFANPLKAKIEALQQHKTIDLPTTQLQVDGADIRSGLQLADVDFEHFTITNQYRRRAHAFIYKTAFKDEDGNETTLINKIGEDEVANMDIAIDPTSALSSVLGTVITWASGKAADYAAVTTDPIALPLGPKESEATYKVRAVGVAFPFPGDLDKMTNAEENTFTELAFETFVIEIFVPYILGAMGNDDLLAKAKPTKTALKKIVTSIKDKIISSAPAAYGKIKQGKFTEALHAFTQSFYDSYLEDFMNLVIKELAFSSEKGLFVQGSKQIGETLNKSIKIIEVIDIGLKATDLLHQKEDILNSRALEEWTVKAKSSDVTLLPARSTVIPFQPKELQVVAKTKLSDGAAFQYDWSTSGKYGTISDKRGHSGTSFTSSLDKITYKSNVQSDALGDGENIDEIYVTVSIKKGNRITKVNTDTARIDVQAFRYNIRPEGITIEGGTNVKLRLRRVDGQDPIAPNSVFDYKVVWSTGGKHGKLEGGENTVTTYDSDSITYEALDKEVKEGTENFTARIYFKSKDKSDWVLLDEAKGSITISNDALKRNFIVPLEISETTSHGSGYDNFAIFPAFKFTPLTGADIPKGFEVANTQITIIEKIPDSRPSCAGVSRTFYPGKEDPRYFVDGIYVLSCGGSAISYPSYIDKSADIAKLRAIYANTKGYAQVTVTFKAKE